MRIPNDHSSHIRKLKKLQTKAEELPSTCKDWQDTYFVRFRGLVERTFIDLFTEHSLIVQNFDHLKFHDNNATGGFYISGGHVPTLTLDHEKHFYKDLHILKDMINDLVEEAEEAQEEDSPLPNYSLKPLKK